jgi:FRG domain-containing protein
MPGEWPASVTTVVDDFQGLQSAVRTLDRGRGTMAFRGYYVGTKEETTPEALVTGLERACNSIDGRLDKAIRRELAVIREFMRRAHHYLSDLPDKRNAFEWLALMQHHGAPTRLLDWTYSLHVATHFALAKASRGESDDLAIWMLDTEWCRRASTTACEIAKRPAPSLAMWPIESDVEERASADLLAPDRPLSVWPINPFRLNERLTLQKGLFLAPGQPTRSFVENLLALPGHDDRANVARFIVRHSLIPQIAKELYDTNVTEATLFPGLDGFARSLWTSTRYLQHRRSY